MKNKKIFLILISSLFAVVTIVSLFALFTVKQVSAEFNVSENCEYASETQKVLDGFVGQNLLFIDVDSVKNEVEKNPYVEVIDISKKFPNVIEVSIKERREIYFFEYGEKVFVADEDGFVLREVDSNDISSVENSRLHISVVFDGISLSSVKVGDFIKSVDIDRINVAFQLAKSAELTDCIDNMRVSKRESTSSPVAGVKQTVVTFSTYTGVEIIIYDVEVKGVEKVEQAFDAYNGVTSDYIKTHKKIMAYISNGIITVEWGNDTV